MGTPSDIDLLARLSQFKNNNEFDVDNWVVTIPVEHIEKVGMTWKLAIKPFVVWDIPDAPEKCLLCDEAMFMWVASNKVIASLENFSFLG